MAKLADKKKKVSTIVHLKQMKNSDEFSSMDRTKNYRQLLEDKITEMRLNLESKERELEGGLKENLQKKKRWMEEALTPILEIKDVLDKTELIEVKPFYRRGKIALIDLKNIVIKSIDYDESQLVKSGFKLEIDFCPKSFALNNKKDCYIVQLLGNSVEQENLKKYYSLESLMDFIINYCSEYLAKFTP